MSVTVTLHLWWLGAYLAVGVVLYLPLCWIAVRQMQPCDRRPVLVALRALPWRVLLVATIGQIALWPGALWEATR